VNEQPAAGGLTFTCSVYSASHASEAAPASCPAASAASTPSPCAYYETNLDALGFLFKCVAE